MRPPSSSSKPGYSEGSSTPAGGSAGT
jgi:hypothetical protein